MGRVGWIDGWGQVTGKRVQVLVGRGQQIDGGGMDAE